MVREHCAPAPSGRRPVLRLPAVVAPLVDQGVISAGTFLFNVLLARAIPLGDYGRFAMMIGIVSLMQAGCASLVFYPLAVRGATAEEGARRRLIVSALWLILAACVPLAAVLAGAVWWLLDGALLLPSFAALAAGQIQEAMRRGLLTGFRHGSAILGDTLSYGGQVALLLVACRSSTVTLGGALWIMAATSLLAAAVQAAQLRLGGARPLPFGRVAADFWAVGRWSLTSNLLGIARGQCLPWLLAALAGPAAAGAFQLALNLVNVVNPVVSGVCNMVPQFAARALGFGYRAAWRASWPAIGTGVPLVVGFVAVLALAPGAALSLVYGARAEPSLLVAPIRILAVAALFSYASNTACAYLHGVLGGRDALLVDVVSTLATAIMGPLLVGLDGLEGACVAFALSFAIRAGGLAFFTATRVLGPGRDRIGQSSPHEQTRERPA